jgi:hypothetical protein
VGGTKSVYLMVVYQTVAVGLYGCINVLAGAIFVSALKRRRTTRLAGPEVYKDFRAIYFDVFYSVTFEFNKAASETDCFFVACVGG